MINEDVELTLTKMLISAFQIQIKYNRNIWNDNETRVSMAELITDTAESIDQLYNKDKTL